MKILTIATFLLIATCPLFADAQTPKRSKPDMNQIEAKIALRELVDTFSILADQKETQKQTELFTEDAQVITHANGAVSTLTGRKEIGDAFANFLKNFDTVYHMNGQFVVSVNESSATGTLYCLTYLITVKDGHKSRTSIGVRYNDNYQLINGRWLITKRTSYFDWQTTDQIQ